MKRFAQTERFADSESKMLCTRPSSVLCRAPFCRSTKPTDPQIAHIAYTANVEPEDNPTSQSLTKQAEATRNKLANLDEAVFDKAYMDNEVT